MTNDKNALVPGAVDRIAAAARGISGACPVIGSLLAEIVGELIPNQRIDRIATFCGLLDDRLQELDAETLRLRLASPEGVDLLEDAMFQAARALTHDRLERLANVLCTGLTAEELDAEQAKRVLWLMGQLSDSEIVVLRGALPLTGEDHEADREYQERHSTVIWNPALLLSAPREEAEWAAIKSSYRQRLVDLGLLNLAFRRPPKGKLPEFDMHTGMIKASGKRVTTLGILLLEYMRLIPGWYREKYG